IYHGGEDDILALVRGLDDQLGTVLLFGHNPVLTGLANRFAREFIPNVPTCGIVKVESPADRWADLSEADARVTEFMYPKQYFT
ncbi:MAG: histidine phosphatase family protein, partial [Bacteroidetes bacterium]